MRAAFRPAPRFEADPEVGRAFREAMAYERDVREGKRERHHYPPRFQTVSARSALLEPEVSNYQEAVRLSPMLALLATAAVALLPPIASGSLRFARTAVGWIALPVDWLVETFFGWTARYATLLGSTELGNWHAGVAVVAFAWVFAMLLLTVLVCGPRRAIWNAILCQIATRRNAAASRPRTLATRRRWPLRLVLRPRHVILPGPRRA